MLGLSWQLPGYQPDDTPPGGALVLSLWRLDAPGNYVVRAQYLAQSLDQMRDATRLTLTSPPEQQFLRLPGCPRESLVDGCRWQAVEEALQQAVDLHATSITGFVSQIP
jgi:4-phytase/acid phosphatase